MFNYIQSKLFTKEDNKEENSNQQIETKEKNVTFSTPSNNHLTSVNNKDSQPKNGLPFLNERKKVKTKEPFPKWGLVHSRMEREYPRKISLEELKQHDMNSERQFTSIHGKVYDITEFKLFHPGGEEILEKYSYGKECGSIFDKYHHYVNYHSLLNNRFIGHLRNLSNE